MVLVLVTTDSTTSVGGEVRHVVIGCQSLEQEGLRRKPKMKPSQRGIEVKTRPLD